MEIRRQDDPRDILVTALLQRIERYERCEARLAEVINLLQRESPHLVPQVYQILQKEYHD